ncbi:MAG: twin-arginine translocation signal domain-containing protein [Desulfopila sp.]
MTDNDSRRTFLKTATIAIGASLTATLPQRSRAD